MRTLLVDADVLVYEVAFGAQKTRYTLHDSKRGDFVFDDAEAAKAHCKIDDLDYAALRKSGGITSHIEVLPEKVCHAILAYKLASIQEACGSDKFLLYLTGKGNFREAVATTRPYKGNRVQEKPVHYDYVRRLISGHHRATVVDGIEADDAIGTVMCGKPDRAVVCTVDKDLCMIPGRRYDWGTGLRFTISPEDAIYWFCKQMLTGDRVDNIPGIPGLGDKKATDLLSPVRGDPRQLWQVVVGEYNKGPFQFGDGSVTQRPEDYIEEQGRLLWIQRRRGEVWTREMFEHHYL